MCIYLFHALSWNPLVGKLCIKFTHHKYIRLTGRKALINVNGLARRLSSMAQRRWRYILSVGFRVGRWICRYGRPALMPFRIVISRKFVPSEVSIVLTLVRPWNAVKHFGKSLVWIQLRLQIRHTRISVSFWRTPGIINASNGRQRKDIRGQIQDTHK